jgi:hypothetical protein
MHLAARDRSATRARLVPNSEKKKIEVQKAENFFAACRKKKGTSSLAKPLFGSVLLPPSHHVRVPDPVLPLISSVDFRPTWYGGALHPRRCLLWGTCLIVELRNCCCCCDLLASCCGLRRGLLLAGIRLLWMAVHRARSAVLALLVWLFGRSPVYDRCANG